MNFDDERPRGRGSALADGLGWFSIALGAVELVSPRTLTERIGLQGREGTVQLYGLREIVTGIGILASRDPIPWIWGRVAGDALDALTLAPALSDDNPGRDGASLAMMAVAGVAVLDLVCAKALMSGDAAESGPPPADFSHRSGLPRPPAEMRGAASDFVVPDDFRTPDMLRPLNETRH